MSAHQFNNFFIIHSISFIQVHNKVLNANLKDRKKKQIMLSKESKYSSSEYSARQLNSQCTELWDLVSQALSSLPHIAYDVNAENLVLDQTIIPKLIFFIFSLLVCLILHWHSREKICLGHCWELKKKTNKVYYDVTITGNCANEKQSVPTWLASKRCSLVCGIWPSVAATTRIAPSIWAAPVIMFWKHIIHMIFITSQVYYKPTWWPAPSWLVDSVHRALHQYCRSHGFKSLTGLNFFQTLFSPLPNQCSSQPKSLSYLHHTLLQMFMVFEFWVWLGEQKCLHFCNSKSP